MYLSAIFRQNYVPECNYYVPECNFNISKSSENVYRKQFEENSDFTKSY